MKDFYLKAIQIQQEKNLYRKLVGSDFTGCNEVLYDGKKLISFASNDYFSLSQNSQVKKATIDAISKFGTSSTASRYVCGNNSLHEKLEKALAKFRKSEDALVFSSGYAGAIGVIPALVGEGDLIIADRLIHSSLIEASKLSGAKLMRFLHNDLTHARQILEENRSKFTKCLIVTETVFSMDGDVGEIAKLLKLADEFNCFLLEDCAHDLMIEQSNSVAKNLPENHIKIGTFSKAFAALGGYVCAQKYLIDYLRNFAKSQIYSTALPPAILASALQSLKIISKKNLGKKALENANYFCDLMNLPKATSAIVVIILGSEEKVLNIAKKTREKGFLISAIRPPTVEKGKARLRITFSSMHKKKHIEKLANHLKSFVKI